MNAQEPNAVRDLLYQKIGRNVVLFQQMETMLKGILRVARFSAPMSTAQAAMAERDAELRKRALGALVEGVGEAMRAQSPETPEQISEPWISYKFTLEGEGTAVKDWRHAMRKIVEERNRLIHQMAAHVDLALPAACIQLGEELDAQLERVTPAYRQMQSLVTALRAQGDYLQKKMDQIVDDLVQSADRSETVVEIDLDARNGRG